MRDPRDCAAEPRPAAIRDRTSAELFTEVVQARHSGAEPVQKPMSGDGRGDECEPADEHVHAYRFEREWFRIEIEKPFSANPRNSDLLRALMRGDEALKCNPRPGERMWIADWQRLIHGWLKRREPTAEALALARKLTEFAQAIIDRDTKEKAAAEAAAQATETAKETEARVAEAAAQAAARAEARAAAQAAAKATAKAEAQTKAAREAKRKIVTDRRAALKEIYAKDPWPLGEYGHYAKLAKKFKVSKATIAGDIEALRPELEQIIVQPCTSLNDIKT
jgi:hypothetical protein